MASYILPGHAVAEATTENCRRWILLLLPVLLPLLLAQHRPYEIHSRQGHESYQDLCNPDGVGSSCLSIFGMTQAGKYLVDKTLYTVGLYTVSPTAHMSDHMSSNTGLRLSSDSNLVNFAGRPHSLCMPGFLGLCHPCDPPPPPPLGLGVLPTPMSHAAAMLHVHDVVCVCNHILLRL